MQFLIFYSISSQELEVVRFPNIYGDKHCFKFFSVPLLRPTNSFLDTSKPDWNKGQAPTS